MTVINLSLLPYLVRPVLLHWLVSIKSDRFHDTVGGGRGADVGLFVGFRFVYNCFIN